MEGCFIPRARGCSQQSPLYTAGWMGPGTECLLSVCPQAGLKMKLSALALWFFPSSLSSPFR